MKYCFEWDAQKSIDVIPGNYFESIIMTGRDMYIAKAGRDEFQLAGVIMPGRRLAGFGRNRFYYAQNVPAGLEAVEAAPSIWVDIANDISALAFKINTDIILDPGLLASCLSLRIEKEDGMMATIALNRPDVRIDWPSRGTFVVTIGGI